MEQLCTDIKFDFNSLISSVIWYRNGKLFLKLTKIDCQDTNIRREKSIVLWVVIISCSSERVQCFGEKNCHHLRDWRVSQTRNHQKKEKTQMSLHTFSVYSSRRVKEFCVIMLKCVKFNILIFKAATHCYYTYINFSCCIRSEDVMAVGARPSRLQHHAVQRQTNVLGEQITSLFMAEK
jgi:hypothetical protein